MLYTLKDRTGEIKYNSYGSKKYVGRYRTIKEAFDVYKKEKQKSIEEFAKYYKNSIPKKIYSAMLNYKVEITD